MLPAVDRVDGGVADCLWPARGVSTQVSGRPRDQARGPENLGSTKRAAQTCSLAPEGKSVQTYPPSRTTTSEERGRTAPNHQAGGLLSPKDAALHMTDVALLAWPLKRDPSSINALSGRIRFDGPDTADRRKEEQRTARSDDGRARAWLAEGAVRTLSTLASGRSSALALVQESDKA
jgi:hypothetical protein